MAGSEKSGILASHHKILKNAYFVLTQTPHTNIPSIKRLLSFITKLGMRSLVLSPQLHDLLVAAVSHLPYLVAVTLTSSIYDFSSSHNQISQLVAGGFRDTTRVASSSPSWGKDILISNHHSISILLNLYNQHLQLLIDKFNQHQFQDLELYFSHAKLFRDSIYKPCTRNPTNASRMNE